MATVDSAEFKRLVASLRAGSESAAWELLEAYGPYILRSVRRSLLPSLRTKFDSADFVQAVWLSFFTQRVHTAPLETPEQLVNLLAAMARHKVVEEGRHRATKKRGGGLEISLQSLPDDGDIDIASRDPSPSTVAMAREQWSRLFRRQPPRYQKMVRLRLGGQTFKSIAREMELDERTVRRVINKLLRKGQA